MKRFRQTDTGYRHDKIIYAGVFLVFLTLIFYVMFVNKFDFSTHPYFECKTYSCENPFYEMDSCSQQVNILFFIPLYKTQNCKLTCDWCNQERLGSGIYGEKPKAEFLLNYMWVIGFSLIAFGLCLNHFIHNKEKKFDIEIVITEKKKFSLAKLMENKNEKLEDNI